MILNLNKEQNMDNCSFEVVWRDSNEDLLELKIEVITEFVVMHQYCYISSLDLINNMKVIRQYQPDPNKAEFYRQQSKKQQLLLKKLNR